ncbi:hypothetical protein [Microbacterium lushaniae]|uniref:Uncharacterized protein n=1 Tax=Microbacterium lushaniae TaxID=2614639 RepID=A0A5J6L700_9MICO|nr:hypothetical protein [Microbacterium lushaniae]QEW04188.1 hypothetical protein F6J85_14565 [Microbacterium lushaniae]
MTDARSRIIRLRWASGLLIAQGTLMELSVFVGVVVLLVLGTPQTTITDRVDIFALPYLNDNLYLMMAMSGIFGVLRVIGAIGLARNQMWGLVLSLFNCGTTLTLMVFLMPPGLLDGLLTGSALVLILTGWLQRRPIVSVRCHAVCQPDARPPRGPRHRLHAAPVLLHHATCH